MHLAKIALALGIALAMPPDARADSGALGSSPTALPGIHRVASAEPMGDRTILALFAGSAYGFASDVLMPEDSHHRLVGSFAAGAYVTRWLALGLRFDGRYDRHGFADSTSDDGWIGDPRLLARARLAAAEGLDLGVQLGLWFPGDTAPSLVFSATTLDGLAIASYAAGALRLAVNAGFRLDNSEKSADNAALLSSADRLSLGISSSNAVLVGAGLGYRLGRAELLAEWTWDLPVGDNAGSTSTAPMRVSAGSRIALGEQLALQIAAEVNLAEAPDTTPGSPLVPFEPAWSLSLGLHYHFTSAETETRPLADQQALGRAAAANKPAVLVGVIKTADGVPIPGANVTLKSSAGESRAIADADGRFRMEDVAAGAVEIVAVAEGYEQGTQRTTASAGQEQSIEITLARVLPEGQLRGYVRSFGGEPIKATLRIESLGREISTGGDGSFELNVAPGTYQVVIEAPRFRTQERTVEIEQGGVTILNVDMQPSKGRRR